MDISSVVVKDRIAARITSPASPPQHTADSMSVSGVTTVATPPDSWICVFLLVTCLAVCTDCMELPPIHWNSSNPMFKTSNNDHVIQVNLFDELDFVCPVTETGEFMEEYYIIYQVSKREYEDCNLYERRSRMMIVNCSNPNQRKRFTLLFYPFVAIPDTPEFVSGLSYYYISTSTGHLEGISNEQQGACLYRNMKLTIRVCCESTTSSLPVSNRTPPLVPSVTMTTTGSDLVTEGVGPVETATSTTTVTTTTRRHTTHHTRRPYPTRSTTEGNSIHHTDKEPDRTPPGGDPDSKTADRDKDKENDVSKDTDSDPKQEGQVNCSVTRTLTPVTGLGCTLALLLLSWLLPWLQR